MNAHERVVLAVPSLGDGGLDAKRSSHFGRCDCFTVIDIEDGAVGAARVVDNPPHVEGGCLRPVSMLAAQGVSAVIVRGIGPRPLASFGDTGVIVYFDGVLSTVREAADAVATGSAEAIRSDHVCNH